MKHLFRIFAFFALLIGTVGLMAGEYGGSPIGPGVSERNGVKLQWEEGSHDYFTMFKTLPATTDPANDNGGQNPSADKCLTESTFVVNPGDMPEDAYVEAAYLIWASAIDPSSIFGNADSTVTLAYTQADGYASETREISVTGHSATDKINQDFEFQGIYFPADGQYPDNGYFTYRADVTDFFTTVHTQARDAGAPSDGAALIGNYTLSNMACSEDQYYATNAYNTSNSIMVGGWTIILIYRSESITPKKIYIYHGFDLYQDQELELTVNGFEFPDKPVIRISLMAHEGDPGWAYSGFKPEGLQVKGQSSVQWAPLFDVCNPLKDKDSDGMAFTYTEMYNCISSFYRWDATEPTCIGGSPDNFDLTKLEYSMDVDTMLLNAEFFPFSDHFKKDDTSFMLKIGANGDMIFTNLLVLSVDTRASKYDIPVNPNTPNGREKHYCSCSTVEDSICFDRPYYYTIKVQNWGDEYGEEVTVEDQLPPQVDYVAGSTEIARAFDANGNGTDWTPVPDGAGGTFPFTTAGKIADVIGYCDPVTKECTDTILVRFKVMPKNGLPKNTIIENTAIINDSTNLPYRSNTTVPLRLRSGNCPSAAECPEPSKALCGGEGQNAAECQTNEECGAGKKCDNGKCVIDSEQFAKDSVVEFALGKNSPSNGSTIFIPNPTNGLVVGQFTLKATSGEGTTKVFSFDDLKVKFAIDNQLVNLSAFKLVRDLNGNGLRDADDIELASATALNAKYADFIIPTASRALVVNQLHYFLVIADAAFQSGQPIPNNSTFNAAIENKDALHISDAGTVTVKDGNVQFADFAFDPSENHFIFTKGPHDPAIPSAEEMKKTIPLLHLRTASPGQANTIEEIQVKTATGTVRYGEGIDQVSLWQDTDNDGTPDQMIANMPTYEPGDSTIRFAIPSGLSLAADETKYLMIIGKLSLAGTAKAAIEIPTNGVKLGTTTLIAELPVRSREFSLACDPVDTTCNGTSGNDDDEDPTEEDTGCGCSTVGDTTTASSALFLLLPALFLLLRRKISRS